MAGHLSFLVCAIFLYVQHASSQVTTSASAVAPTFTGQAVQAYVYPPLTVTGQFPCLTANSYMIFTDSVSSSATYPIWTCTSSCGSLSSGVGLMVFPATTTTGTYEVQNPPSGYPALEVSNLVVITDTAFSTTTSIDIDGPLPTTTTTFTYSAFPGLTLTVTTTTPIPAVTATPISVPAKCQGGGGPRSEATSGVSSATALPTGSSASTGSTVSGANISGGSGWTLTSAAGGVSSASGLPAGSPGGSGSHSASSWASSVSFQSGGLNPTVVPNEVTSTNSQSGTPTVASSSLSVSSGISVSSPSGGSNPSSSSSGVSLASASSGQPGGSNSASASTGVPAISSVSISTGNSNVASASALVSTRSASSGQAGVSNPSSASSGLSASLASSNGAKGPNPTSALGGVSASSVASGQTAGSNPPSASSSLSAISASSNLVGGSNPSSASSGQSAVPNSASSNQPGAPSGQSSTFNSLGQAPASNSASNSASASVTQVLPPGASVVTSVLPGASGGSASASTVVETFLPTVISSLTSLSTPLTTSSIITYGTSSTSALPITIFPGGTAWQIPSVGPGTPILSPPTAAPTVGTASANPASGGSSATSGFGASSGVSGFTTVASSNPASSNSASPGSSAGYLGPVPISAEPASITAALASQSSANVIGLTTYTGTTSPVYVQYSSGVSSNGHTQATGGAAPFPLFWSHTCWFCPPGLCFFCGISLHLPPGIYPPGSIDPPPGWTGPLPEITIGQDGTPSYPEEDPNDPEKTNQPSNQPSTAQGSSNSPSQTTMASSQTSLASTGTQSTVSSQTSGGFECAQTGCAVCVDNDPPSSYQSPTSKLKRSRLVERETTPFDGNLSPPAKNPDILPHARSYAKDLAKRKLPEPGDAPWNGDQDSYLWTQYLSATWVPLRQDPNFPSSALAFGLAATPFSAAVQGLYGCTSLMIISTQGVWMSHLWENPSFQVGGVVNQANFQAQILDRLGPGDGTAEFPGLNQYLNTEFAADTKPVAIILTPRNRANPQPNVLMFQNQITQLSEKVQTLFGGTRTSSGQFTGGTLNGIPLIVDYTPKSDDFSQTWTSSGKALFQYDPVEIRCNGVQWAMVRLWVEDRVLYTYKHYWVARANQIVAAPAIPQQAGNQKRQVQSADDTPAPSCLASMTATGSVSMGIMSGSGSVPSASAVSGSSTGSASSLSSSPATVPATTTGAGANAATSLAAASLAAVSRSAVAAASAAQITMDPLCVPTELTGGGDGGVENCLEAALCECSSGTVAGTYTTMTGTNQCGYTTIPSSQWNPNDQICTIGLSASNLRPPKPTTTGKYIFTETDLPVTGSGTVVYGCTSTYTSEAGPVIGTYCAGSKTPLTTIFPPIKTPTGAPATPSCNSPANPQDASAQGDPDGYVPDPVFFEAAIGVFCGPSCKGQSGCLAATGETLSSNMDAFKATFFCSDAQSAPGGNKTLDCEPNDWENNPPPYWEASGIMFNLGIKLIDKSCQWTVDSDTCNKWLSNTLTGCPAAGIDWNECVAWTVGAGAASLSLSDWESDHPKNTW